MNRFYPALLFILIGSNVLAQELSEPLKFLKENTVNVTVREEVIEQSFSEKDENYRYEVVVNNTTDGKVNKYEFNAADLNEYKITFKTGKKEVYVSAETKGGKDLIRVYENDVIKGYDDGFRFFASDIEQARAITENFKAVVGLAAKAQENIGFVLGDTPEIDNALAYLKENIGKISVNEKSFAQSFNYDQNFKSLMKLHIADEGEGKTRIYELNASDLNLATVQFDTRSEFVFVSCETKGKRKLIKVFENGELNNYEDTYAFYTSDIDDARRLVEVLKYYIQEAENLKSNRLAELENLNSLGAVNEFITRQVTDVVVGSENNKQAFSTDDDKGFFASLRVEDVNEEVSMLYNFNLADLNENELSFNTRGNKVVVELNTSGGRNLIMTHKNGELESYKKQASILADGIEEARYLVEGLKKSVKISKQLQEKNFIPGNDNPTKDQTIEFLTKTIKDVVIGEDAYKQKFETDAEKKCLVSINFIDVSEGKSLTCKMNMMDINIHKINFETKLKEVVVKLETIGENKLIEKIEEGVTEGFSDDVVIRANDIEEARKIEMALEHLTELCNQ